MYCWKLELGADSFFCCCHCHCISNLLFLFRCHLLLNLNHKTHLFLWFVVICSCNYFLKATVFKPFFMPFILFFFFLLSSANVQCWCWFIVTFFFFSSIQVINANTPNSILHIIFIMIRWCMLHLQSNNAHVQYTDLYKRLLLFYTFQTVTKKH